MQDTCLERMSSGTPTDATDDATTSSLCPSCDIKHQLDKQRTERTFAIGDDVFGKLHPHVQTLVCKHVNHKLAFKYFGPFKIFRRSIRSYTS